jgi:hypothetical protein
MSLRMLTALSVLLTVALMSSNANAAEYTGGYAYPMPGLTIDNHVYYFNVTSYANISMDLRDMLVGYSWCTWQLSCR